MIKAKNMIHHNKHKNRKHYKKTRELLTKLA